MIHEILNNGLDIFILVDRKSPIFAFQIFYRVGSMDETPGKTGMCHLIEHMRFKGTQKIKGPEIDLYVKRHGGSLNGMTSEDATSYYMTLPSSEIEFPIKVEAELMTEALFDANEFETERNVIMEERRLTTEDSPIGSLYEAFKATAFWVHPYRFPVIGFMSDLSRIQREEAYEFYRTFYRPDNAYVIIKGDVAPDETIKLIKQYFADIKTSSDPPIKRFKIEEPRQNGERRVIINKSAELPIVMIGFHSPNLQSDDVYPLIVAQKILSSGKSSRIFRNIIYEKRIATSAGGFFNYFARDPHLFIFYALASVNVNADTLEKALLEEAEKICNDKSSDEEIEKAKNIVESDFIFQREENLSECFIRGLFHLSNNMDKYDSFPERVRDVTADSVRDACAKIFTRENMTIAHLNPTNGKGGNNRIITNPTLCFYSNSPHMNFSNIQNTTPSGLPYWKESDKFELSKGIKVIAYKRHELPIFQIVALVNSGSVYDPEGKFGLSSITANLLRAGTASRTSFEIASEIENLGGDFHISTHREYSIFSMKILSRHIRVALDILSECLIFPSFLDEELQRFKELAQGEIKAIEDDVWALTAREFNRLIFDGSPYSHPVLGEPETIDMISVTDVKNFHQEFFNSNNTLLIIVGDFYLGKLKTELESYFSKMPIGEKHSPPEVEFKPINKIMVSRFKKDLEQASIAIGAPLFPRKSADYFPYLALDHILGYGSLTSRLGVKLRQEKGLTYDIESGMRTMSRTGFWNIVFQTKKENVLDAVNLVREEIRKIREEPVSDEELSDFKNYAKGRCAFDVESNQGLAQKLLTNAYYDLGDDYLSNFFKYIESITKEQIMEVAQKYLNPDKFKMLIVGDTDIYLPFE